MEDRVKTILSDILGIQRADIGDDASMQTIAEWGSLQHMDLIASLEENFNVRLTVDHIVKMTNLKSILAILHSYGA